MAQKDSRIRRLTPKRVAINKDGLIAVKRLKNYAPQRQEFSHLNLKTLEEAMAKAHEEEIAAKNAYDKARDAAVAMEWEMHDFFQGAAEAVLGQFGSNSDEYASLGFKKKREYKKTAPRKGKS